MATWQKTVTMDIKTKAGITEWISTVQEAMVAIGCVQTDDQGQLDINDYPDPVLGTTNILGFRIYELNDSNSLERPIYMKIVFRAVKNGAASSLVPETHISVGFSTDGHGNMVGVAMESVSPISYYYHNTGGETPAIPNSPCYACKIDGFIFLAIGLGCMQYGSSTPITATFFAISRTSDFAILYHPFNTRIDNNSTATQTDLAYSYADFALQGTMPPINGAIPSPSRAVSAGLLVANPAVICGSDNAFADRNVVSVPIPEAEQGTVIMLSNDDFEDRTYLVIPAPTGIGSANVQRKLNIVADTKYRFSRAIAMRWE